MARLLALLAILVALVVLSTMPRKDAPDLLACAFSCVSPRPPEPLLLTQHYDVDDVPRLYVRVLDALLELPQHLPLRRSLLLSCAFAAQQKFF